MANVALLVSRQPRLTSPRTWWVRGVRAACEYILNDGHRLVTGEGLLPIDFAAWVIASRGGSVQAFPTPAGPKTAALEARDHMVADAADRLIAVAVRSGGIMERIATERLERGRAVFALRPPPVDAHGPAHDNLLLRGALPLEVAIPDFSPSDPDPFPEGAAIDPPKCLWHLTRSSPGPWPGQSREEFFRDLVENAPGAAHSARDALARILRENRIRASGRMYRGGFPMVAFTEAAPAELLSARRFRPPLARWDFEPVGIGVRFVSAVAAGLRQVSYLSPDAYDALGEEERPFYQKSEPGRIKTEHEREWRHRGDVDLSRIPLEDQFLYDSGACIPRAAIAP
jgi:hypothetical protein